MRLKLSWTRDESRFDVFRLSQVAVLSYNDRHEAADGFACGIFCGGNMVYTYDGGRAAFGASSEERADFAGAAKNDFG
jgi:hypothetical protein